MSLLTQVFSFLGFGSYNPPPAVPSVATAQPLSLQVDQNGRLLVAIAAISAGAPLLALPVTTTSRIITTPGVQNSLAVSAPFNTSGGTLTQTMPEAPVRGMRVTIGDSGGVATVTPASLTDANGYKIQSPLNPASIVSTLSFAWSGFAATWEFVTNDPTNGSFWMVVRSLQ